MGWPALHGRMRKLIRMTVAGAAGLVVLVISLALSAVTGVDRRPASGSAWAESTRERLDALGVAPVVADTDVLEAGFGRAELTPRKPSGDGMPGDGEFVALPMAGYGARQGRPATGAHDPLWAKAVALRRGSQRVVMVTADVLIIPRNVATAATALLADTVGLRPGEVYFGATHTHGSLGGWGEGPVGEIFAGGFDPRAVAWFAGRLADAARRAWEDLSAAGVAHSGFDAPQFVRNRLVGDAGRVDPRFDVILVRQDDGDLAVMGSYAAHATVLGPRVMEWTGDYPGAWQRAVESATGGMALFFAGGVGSHSPRAPAPGFEGAEALGRELARRTVDVVRELVPDPRPSLRLATLRVDLPELQVRLTDGLRLRLTLAAWLLPVAEDTRLQALRIGSAIWFSTPCDFSGELTLELRERLAPLGLGVHVTSFNGDYLGYVIPSRYDPLDGYEPRTMSFHGPALSDYLLDLLEAMGRRVGGDPEVGIPFSPRSSLPAAPRR